MEACGMCIDERDADAKLIETKKRSTEGRTPKGNEGRGRAARLGVALKGDTQSDEAGGVGGDVGCALTFRRYAGESLGGGSRLSRL